MFLKFTNGFDKIVRVKGMREVSSSGVGAAGSLWLLGDIELEPNGAQEVDITDKLRLKFNLDSPERQERTIEIGLSLEPEPPNQHLLTKYRVVFEKGHFVEFVLVSE